MGKPDFKSGGGKKFGDGAKGDIPKFGNKGNFNKDGGGKFGGRGGGKFGDNRNGGKFGGKDGGNFGGNRDGGNFGGNRDGGKFGGNRDGGKFGGNRDGGKFGGGGRGGGKFGGGNRDGGKFGGGGRGGGGRGGGAGRGGRGGAPRGGARGGKGGPRGMSGGKNVIVEPHQRLPGVFIMRGKEDALVTLNQVPGESVYGEKRISVEAETGKIEYRIWNPFRSKLGAAILGGVEQIYMKPGSKVLYLGAASGTTVSHVSDIVGETGRVYAVEFSHRSGRDLLGVAQKRNNIVPIIDDARHPHKYRAVMSMVDCIFSDVAQPDQARIIALNAHQFLKPLGHIVMSIKANCIDSTAPAESVFAGEVRKLKEERIKPLEQVTLEPYERDHAVVVGVYRADDVAKNK